MQRNIAVILLSGCLILGLALAARAQENEGLVDDSTTKSSGDLLSNTNEQNAATQQRLMVLEKKVGELSGRLGSSFGSTTIERRISDLDRRLTKMEKEIDQIKGRVSKVESKK